MFSSKPNYTKLKTNLKLAVNRLKLLEKKKAEIAQKSRKEIADFLATGKTERARIRVEHIIREDYLVEAMEVVEMYCDLLLARFGLVTQMKELDDGIAEAVASVVWVCPRLQSDVAELKVISDIFIQKYGPEFAEKTRTATGDHHVSEKLMHKLQLQAPPKLLVEKYLIEIAKNYNIEYEPDPQVINEDNQGKDQSLIDLSDRNNLGGSGEPPQMGFIGYPSLPPMPSVPNNKPFNYPPPYGGGGGGGSAAAPLPYGGPPVAGGGPAAGGPPPFNYNIPPNVGATGGANNEVKDLNTQFINEETKSEMPSNFQAGDDEAIDPNILRQKMDNDPPPRYTSINPMNLQNSNKPKPQPRSKMPPPTVQPSAPPPSMEIPQLPNVPMDLPDIPSDDIKPNNNDDDIDFDDLSKRFENLKKRR
ncbi:increased sodium tolerance 1-like protein isoform X1 [Musca autumnalis]|uniref:increased sodium tolerance 1-like protein isoform X1 n=1 Tax=Musca autumnalis TaxID=221902 RepID=UPI003CE9A249